MTQPILAATAAATAAAMSVDEYTVFVERWGVEALADAIRTRRAYFACTPAQKAALHDLLKVWGHWPSDTAIERAPLRLVAPSE